MPRPKKKTDQVRIPLGAAVLPEIDSEIQSIASAQERSKSSVIEKLLLRGLAAYREDGRLTVTDSVDVHGDNETKIQTRKAAVG